MVDINILRSIDLDKDDIIILTSDEHLTLTKIDRIKEEIRIRLNIKNKVAIIDNGMRFNIIRPA